MPFHGDPIVTLIIGLVLIVLGLILNGLRRRPDVTYRRKRR